MRGCFGPWSRTRETPPRSASKDGDRGAGGVGLAADQQGYWRLDKLIAVPRLLGDELQDDQAKVAVGEEAAEASSASLPTMRTAVVVVVLAVLYAAEATAVALIMGMSVVHFFRCV